MTAVALFSDIFFECEMVLAKSDIEHRTAFLTRMQRIEHDLADIKWIIRSDIRTIELAAFGNFMGENTYVSCRFGHKIASLKTKPRGRLL
ncbi:MAG: hypothetical protein GY822_13165 [Deltaproteobacteria bacterium]|nr:hypothetical protein [Deltaproteobacteria bacterium]